MCQARRVKHSVSKEVLEMIDDKQLHSVPGMEGYYYDDDMQLYTVCQLKKQRETQCVYRIRIHGVPTNFNLEEYLTQRVNHTVSRLEHSVSGSDHTVPESRHSVPESSFTTHRVEHSVSDRDPIHSVPDRDRITNEGPFMEQGPYEDHKDVEHSVSDKEYVAPEEEPKEENEEEITMPETWRDKGNKLYVKGRLSNTWRVYYTDQDYDEIDEKDVEERYARNGENWYDFKYQDCYYRYDNGEYTRKKEGYLFYEPINRSKYLSAKTMSNL